MVRLSWARLLVAAVPFNRWRASLGGMAEHRQSVAEARKWAADVEWAAKRLPFATKCLPRSMALSWLLRRATLRHSVVIAARPTEMRGEPDALHAWVEVDGEKIVGDLPGPWIEVVRIGG